MTDRLEMLIDLVVATLADVQKVQMVAIVHESLRVFPLTESSTRAAYVNLRTLNHFDFHPVAGGFPALKERVSAIEQPDTARDILARAGLVVASVSSDASVFKRIGSVKPGKQWWLLYGHRRAGGWAFASQLMRDSAVKLLEFGESRVLISEEILGVLGGPHSIAADAIPRYAEAVAKMHPNRLTVEDSPGHMRIRVTAEPLRWIAAGNEWLSHNLMQENRALFNARGLGSLIVPWADRCTLLLLLRNVRDRIDSLTIAFKDQSLRPSRVDYTEHGALLAINQPEIAPEDDALLHLELPRSAVPNDGFCDIGALSASMEIAA